jgi:hypothetical protein
MCEKQQNIHMRLWKKSFQRCLANQRFIALQGTRIPLVNAHCRRLCATTYQERFFAAKMVFKAAKLMFHV